MHCPGAAHDASPEEEDRDRNPAHAPALGGGGPRRLRRPRRRERRDGNVAVREGASPPTTLYTQTNDPAGNRVQALATSHDDKLSPGRSFPTGGKGTGGGLSNQGSVVIADKWLLAVNAGSDELSLFRILDRRGLALRDVVPSRGNMLVSVTSDGRRAYVVNAGASSGVAGFAIDDDGRLTPNPGLDPAAQRSGGRPRPGRADARRQGRDAGRH